MTTSLPSLEILFGLNVTSAVASAQQLGDAVDTATTVTTAGMRRIEGLAESMVKSLDRQAATAGKTSQQVTELKAQTLAAAAAELNMTELSDRLTAAYGRQAAAANHLDSAHQSMGASGMIVQHVVRSTTDSFAAGLPVSMIFAEQIGRLGEAAALSGGSMGKFGAIMAGPWGIAITAGIGLLAQFVPKLWENSEAADAAAKAADNFKSHQSDIGNFVDKATGALIEQNKVLVRNAILLRQTQIDANNKASRDITTGALSSAQGAADPNGAGATIWQRLGAAASLASGMTPQMLQNNQIAAALKASGGDLGKLDDLLSKIAQHDPTLKALTVTVSNAAAQTALMTRENKKAADEIAVLQGQTEGHTRATTGLINKQVALATATTAVEKARAQYALVQEGAAAADKAGGKALDDYRASLTAAAVAVNRAEEAEKAAREARKEGRHDATEAAKDARTAARLAKEHADNQIKLLQDIGAAKTALDDRLGKSVQVKFTTSVDGEEERLARDLALHDGIKKAIDEQNRALQGQADIWSLIDQQAVDAANGMEAAFGRVGGAIGGLTAAMTGFYAQQAQLDAEHARRLDELRNDQAGTATENILYAKKSAAAQEAAFGSMIHSAQGFFKQGSAGYKALGAVEKAYRAVQMAETLANFATQIGLIGVHVAAKVGGDVAMAASDTARTAVEKGNSLASTAVKAVEAVVNAIRSLPFPANLVAGAATAAAIATLGVAVGGGFGGGGTKPVTNTGTGTVFGDDKAQSESLSKSLDLLKDVDTLTMRYSGQMLASLKNIENLLGSATNALIAGGDISDNMGVKDTKSLFSSKKVVGEGISIGAQSLDSILSDGLDAQYYTDTKKKKLFGGTKYKTSYGGDASDVEDQFALVLKSFDDTILAAAGPLGLATDEVSKTLNSFIVDIGKVDLHGLTGDEIQKKLEAVFSATGDRLAAAAIPGLAKFEKAGEGYLETLTRVATTVETVNESWALLGRTTMSTGIDASMSIAGVFDSLSDFSDATKTYFDDFYSDAEKAALQSQELGKAFGNIGLAMPATVAGFRQLVEAQDLSTAAGQANYGTLLKLAPAFYDLKKDMDDTAASARSASDIMSERLDLERQLLEINGDTAALRALDRAKIDDSNKALYDQVMALQDAKDAAAAAAQAAETVAQAEKALASQRDSLNRQLLQAAGDTAGIRALDLAAMDETLRPIQEHIYALQDQAAATAAAAQAAQAAAQVEEQIAQQREQLQGQLWQLTGNTAAIRAAELAKITDPMALALQKQIYAETDRQAAAAAAQQAAEAATQAADQLREAWASIASDIMDEVKRIRGLTDTAPQSYMQLLGQFNDATSAARGGDQDAAKSLTTLSKSLLDAANDAATSQQELKRIQAMTATSLEQTYGLITGATSAASVALASGGEAWTPQVVSSAAAGGSDSDAEVRSMRAEIVSMKEAMTSLLAKIETNTNRGANVLENASNGTGGDGFTVEVRAA